jgi:hypothetical protein
MTMGRGQLAVAGLIGLALFRLGRFVLGVCGLWVALGPLWALAAALLVLAFGTWLPLRVGVFLGAMALWHWPWFAALALAAPRLLLMLPGLVASALARLRHPRARWPAAWTSEF